MNTQRIGSMHLDKGVREVHYLCVLTMDEWGDADSSAEASEQVREAVEARHRWEVEGFGADLDVVVIEHPVLVRGFIGIARLTDKTTAHH